MVTRAQILCGDAAEVLQTIPENHVALTVTSPPYYQHRDYGVRGQIGREPRAEEYLAKIRRILAEILRVTDASGSCFFVVGDTFKNRKLLLIPHRIALAAVDAGWTVRNDLIWHKPDPAYDRSHLVADTLRLLSADAAILDRMENMRRATIYAEEEPAVAAELLRAVVARLGGATRAP